MALARRYKEVGGGYGKKGSLVEVDLKTGLLPDGSSVPKTQRPASKYKDSYNAFPTENPPPKQGDNGYSPSVITDATIRESVIPDLNQRANALAGTAPSPYYQNNQNQQQRGGQQNNGLATGQPNSPTTQNVTSEYDDYYQSLIDQLNTGSDDSSYDRNIENLLTQMGRTNDQRAQRQTGAIQSMFDVRRQQLEQVNAGEQAGLRGALRRAGSRYAPLSTGGAMSQMERNGVLELAQLDAQEQAAIADVLDAQQEGDFKLMGQRLEIAEAKRAEKNAVREKLMDLAIEENKKAREKSIQSTRDNAVASLFEQGIVKPEEMLNYLNFDEDGNRIGDFTLEEVDDSLSRLAGADEELTAPIKEYQFAKSQGYEGTFMDYQRDRDPNAQIDNMYKMLQIQKLERDLSGAGSNIDPITADAAAREYASSGKIPSYVDKSAIATIIARAKEIPKVEGTVIDINTGVAPTTISATESKDFATLYNVIKNLKELDERFTDIVPGVIGGTVSTITGSDDLAAYNRLKKVIIDDISRMQSGAALTQDEVEFYSSQLPGRFSNSLFLGTSGNKTIKDLQQQLIDKLKTRTKAAGVDIVGLEPSKEVLDKAAEFDENEGTVSLSIPKTSRLSYVNNNPGNLRFANQPGATKGEGGFAKFKTPEAGLRALENQVALDASRGLTVAQFINKYAPPSENDTDGYVAFIKRETGVDPQLPLSRANKKKIINAIARMESGTTVNYI